MELDRRGLLAGVGLAAGAAGVSQAATPDPYGPITALLTESEAIADRFGMTDPALRAAFRRQVLMSLSGAYVEGVATSVENPDFVPYLPYYLPRSGPNPDTIYRFAPVVPEGVYRLSGTRGTDTLHTVTLRKGGAHLGTLAGTRTGEIDLKALPVDGAGRFEAILSATRPAGWTGPWFELTADTRSVMSRNVSKTIADVEGTCGIERLDRAAGPIKPAPGELEARMETLAQYVLKQVSFLPGYLAGLRKKGAGDGFILDEQSEYGGLVSQLYHYYLFDVGPDEAVILESVVPGKSPYWSVQLMDPLARSIDFVLHQSSLNDAQAQVDADGRTRCVISLSDPGVANWLDPAGWRQGAVIWRWNAPDVTPQPKATKVKLKDLKKALPKATPAVGGPERAALMKARAAFYQSRRR